MESASVMTGRCVWQIAAVGAAFAVACAVTGQMGYTFHDLGALGGAQSKGHAVNQLGQVVGSAETPSGYAHAFLWEDGLMRDLVGSRSSAWGINDAQHVVGNLVTMTGDQHAFLLKNGTLQDLGTLGGDYSLALAINNEGQVVGRSATADGEMRAFLWQNGVMHDLCTLGGCGSCAYGINDWGQVVGEVVTADGLSRAVLWENGVMYDLGTLGGDYSLALAINNAGQVVGGSATAGGEMRAFLWQNGVMHDLCTLGGYGSCAYGINDGGQVVGGVVSADGLSRAVLWENGVMYDLHPFGEGDSDASDISDAGHVVGCAFSPSGRTRAVLWWPTKPVVVLVRGLQVVGWGDADQYWEDAVEALQQDFEVGVCDTITGKQSVGVETNALHVFIEEKLDERQRMGIDEPSTISILAHSYGGLISRLYAHERMRHDKWPDDPRVEKIVMLSGVNCGSHLADLGCWFGGWVPGMGNKAALDCLTTHYVQEVFNRTYNDLVPSVPFTLLGGTGGSGFGWWWLYGWPIGTFNENDGAITVYSAHGFRWKGTGPWWDRTWKLERQVGGTTMTTADDHGELTTDPVTLELARKALLGETLLPWQVVSPSDGTEAWVLVAMACGEIGRKQFPDTTVAVDDCGRVSFLLSNARGYDFTLTDPNGAIIDPSSPDPNVHYTAWQDEAGTYACYEIDTPLAGFWKCNVDLAGGGWADAGWNLIVGEQSELRLVPGTEYFQNPGGAVVAAAIVDASQMAVGADIWAEVLRPDGAVDRLALFDDGLHSDGSASDGVYANTYEPATAAGIYNVRYGAAGINSAGHAFQRLDADTFQVASGGAALTGAYADSGLDLGPPPGLEEVEVEIGVNVAVAGQYAVSAVLTDEAGNEVAAATAPSLSLPAGPATFTLRFDGDALRRSGVNGPYVLTNVALWDDSGELSIRSDHATNAHTTAPYGHGDFSDTCPPEAIGDLTGLKVLPSGITLTWSAPSSEGDAAAEYDIRYYTAWLFNDTWDLATSVANPPVPGLPGSQQTLTLPHLPHNNIYYIGIRSRDAMGNWSAISNVPVVPIPAPQVPPTRVGR
jgi:probable HAF family extracellular repeat protein